MITENEKTIIQQHAKNYNVAQVYLFGSALTGNTYTDIDLGVKGIKSSLFFEFYGKLLRSLPKPCDLINLDKNSKFCSLAERDGELIYG